MSDLSPLSGAKLKSDFGAVRAAFDPFQTLALGTEWASMLLLERVYSTWEFLQEG
jgi:hypothetical protein